MTDREAEMTALLREPALHFLALGLLVFLGYGAVGGGGAAPEDTAAGQIVVTAAETERLAAGFTQTWRRAPEPAELEALVAGHVREAVLVREARALGLDAGDPVIRQRLRQKMEFLLEAQAGGAEPGPGELEAFHAAHGERFSRPPRLTFTQVYLGEAPAEAEVAAARAGLDAGTDPGSLGRRTMLPARFGPAPPAAIDTVFGPGMFAAVEALPQGTWAGPVRSGFGLHLVRVDAHEPPVLPPFGEIAAAVRAAWEAETRRAATEALIEALVARYEIVRPGGEAGAP
ncbi:peptidylprolyl isomerase [Paralimibaculum aggregatum]|uniref:Peptidylprolyl isomerase n=1 Tax=Paralimibaculum aggregatum TaxID=3036245 RepID=A0ABQ6LJT6_9RHOB|nr:peptidylprolyl isomerase [Limibaculum sp. NKW23]GMG83522.1 peptidylprolyl isomerase [Limibaculum sp. NKW23]